MSVGQHLADVAAQMVRRGHRVIVLTADRGYDDPAVSYPRHEVRDGVEVWRLPWASLGKRSLRTRILAAGSFLTQSAVAALGLPRLDAVLTSTVPPLAGAAALPARWLRGVPLVYWVMDLNPEQLVALGRVAPGAAPVRALDRLNRTILGAAERVVALDRFMAARLAAKADLGERLAVIPPWPHEDQLEAPAGPNPFRAQHGLKGKQVFMYSGNHSPSNPLNTFLEASLAFRDDPRVAFLFVGGGQGKREVEEFIDRHALRHVRSLPYQPLAELRHSLAAADVHLVSLGDPLVGVIHPCKVYGALAVGRPVLYLGPRPSHVTDLLERYQCGWCVAHGDVEGAVRRIREILALPPDEQTAIGERGRRAVREAASQDLLRGRMCDLLEGVLRPASA